MREEMPSGTALITSFSSCVAGRSTAILLASPPCLPGPENPGESAGAAWAGENGIAASPRTQRIPRCNIKKGAERVEET